MLPDVLSSVKASTKGIDQSMAPSDAARLDGLHLSMWVRGDPVTGLAKQQLDGVFGALEGGSEEAAGNLRHQRQQIDLWLDGVKTMGFGLSLNDQGFLLRGGFTLNPESDLSKQTAMKSSTTLLTGLPASNYCLLYTSPSPRD